MGETLIEATGLTKRYGDRTVVDRLDLTVSAGEVFGLLGPNGAGKTTTILMLLGLTEPTAGRARVVGLDPARHPLAVKEVVGYLPDNVGFYDGMTGRENLRYTTRLNRIAAGEAEGRIDRALDEVGLTQAADARVGTFSRGMRQRLGLADALVKRPRVLVLDEPTIAIDPEGVLEIQHLVRRLADEHRVAVLLSSHLLHQMQRICDRVGIFVAGRMVASGTTAELSTGRGAGATYQLDLDGDPDGAERLLRSAAGVDDVSPGEVPGSWQVVGAADLAPELAAAVVGAGMRLRRLDMVGGDLDTVYRRHFAGETAP